MTEKKPLTPEQRIVASRVAAGEEIQAIARDIGKAPRSVSRWKDRDDFRELVRKQRAALVGEVESAEEVARSALVAVKRDGSPDWQARLQACKILMSAPVTSDEGREAARRTERIYVTPDESDFGAPRPLPNDPDGLRHRDEEAEHERIAAEVEP